MCQGIHTLILFFLWFFSFLFSSQFELQTPYSHAGMPWAGATLHCIGACVQPPLSKSYLLLCVHTFLISKIPFAPVRSSIKIRAYVVASPTTSKTARAVPDQVSFHQTWLVKWQCIQRSVAAPPKMSSDSLGCSLLNVTS